MITDDGSHDFDFLHGSWRVHNRKLRQRLAGSTDWIEFEGRAVERPLWDGQANIEEWEADMPSGRVRGLALRLFNPHSRQWSIHWSGSDTGTLDNPVTGEFRERRGEFYGTDTCDGRQILARFVWTSNGADVCQWEQAFSPDGGRTWETNWIMEFSRAR
ncbi:MAG: hypothetical protein ABI969_10035 [bacterium]